MGDIPNPGSDEAIAQGCTCPVLDNGLGVAGERRWWINATCPLHGVAAGPHEEAIEEGVRS